MKDSTKKIITLVIALYLIIRFRKLITLIMLIGVVLLCFLVWKKLKKKEIKQEEDEILEINDTSSHDKTRMKATLVQEKIDEKRNVMKDTDIRQFKGRKDVTVEEVAEYLINHSQFIGIEKRNYQMQRITQVCNLTEDDMKEVSHLIWGKTKVLEDKEGQKQRDWEIEQLRKKVNSYIGENGERIYVNEQNEVKSIWQEWKESERKYYKTNKEYEEAMESFLSKEKIKQLEEKEYRQKESTIKFACYEDWLKKKGYV